MTAIAPATISIREAAALLGRDRTRVYALVRSGDLVAVPDPANPDQTAVRLDRSSAERWAVAGGSRGSPLTPRNAWAIIGLASGDGVLADHCLGLLERREELSRARARAADGLLTLAPRLRRRASLSVLHLPPALFVELERDDGLVRTGISAVGAYGWHVLRRHQSWALDAYLRPEARQVLVDKAAPVADQANEAGRTSVLLRSVEGDWPFPSHYQFVPQPLAALDLLDYSDTAAQRLGRVVLRSLAEKAPTVGCPTHGQGARISRAAHGKAAASSSRPRPAPGRGR